MRALTAPLVLLVLAAAVGCSQAGSEADAVRDQVRGYVHDLQAGRVGDACRRTTDVNGCQAAVAAARALGTNPADAFPSAAGQLIDDAAVTITGTTAVMELGPTPDRLVKRDGAWLLDQR